MIWHARSTARHFSRHAPMLMRSKATGSSMKSWASIRPIRSVFLSVAGDEAKQAHNKKEQELCRPFWALIWAQRALRQHSLRQRMDTSLHQPLSSIPLYTHTPAGQNKIHRIGGKQLS